jgi:serine/threonine protein kinase
MEADRYHRARQLFDEAIRLAPADRDQYLEQMCGADAELATRVRRMIGFAEDASPTVGLIPDRLKDDSDDGDQQLIGTTISQYRIVELIGQGGFGAVYRAERDDPVQLVVALKVIQSGMDSRSVLGRFKTERETLALMEHPNIARVFDAGQASLEQGSRPFVVMEFVDGKPITDYCDHKALSLKARLELFMTVCQGVQHAHQKGIIHRDLKPSNILVTEVDGAAIPKIIDFGIAKAIRGPLTDRTLVTNRQELLGTPQYMSPEQAQGNDQAIDTRTDVYSLGAVLYELLTGSTPLNAETLRSTSYSDMLKMIVEQRVERPSTRLARTGDAARKTARVEDSDGKSLRRQLRGELDWITMKALDADRERRYSSASDLAEDIGRYLNHEPVRAGPPGTAYRVRKFVRRHRLGVGAAAVATLAILGGATTAVIGMVQAREAAAQAQQINQFMRDVLTSPDPDRGQGADVRLVEVLKSASETSSQRFAGYPELELQVRDLLGQVYHKLSLFPQCAAEYKRAADLSESFFGPDDPRTLAAWVAHVGALASSGRIIEQVTLDELTDRIERALGRTHDLWFTVQHMRGMMLSARRQRDEAVKLQQDLLQQAQAAGADESIQLGIMKSLVRDLWRQLENARGPDRASIGAVLEPVAREWVDRSARYFGPTAVHTLVAQQQLADSLCELGKYEDAAVICRALLDAPMERLGECHTVRKNAMSVLARALLRLGQADQAAEVALRAIECERLEAPIAFVSEVASAIPILDRGGRWSEGERVARELKQGLEELGGGHGPMVLDAELSIARFISLQGRTTEADQLFASLLTRQEEASQNLKVLARMHLFYGAHLMKQGRYDEAEQRLQMAVDALGDIRHGTWNNMPDDVIIEFIALYQAWGKPDKVAEYERLREEALRLREHPELAD